MVEIENIKQMQISAETLRSGMDQHSNQLTNLFTKMSETASETNKNIYEMESKKMQLTESLKSVESQIDILKNSNKDLSSQISSAKKIVDESEKEKSILEKDLDIKENKLQNLTNQIKEYEENLEKINMEISSKQSERDTFNETNNAKITELQQELDKTKTLTKSIDSEYGIWSFLLEKANSPEIEIISIVAANRKISIDEIKKQAKNVQAVFVGRALNTLESDGKLIQDNGLWDLSPQLLKEIE